MTTIAQPTGDAQPGAGARLEPLAAAKAPVGPGKITAVGVVLALGLLSLGVIALHDALIPSGLVAGPSWIDSGLTTLHGSEPAPWMVPSGLLMATVGVWALVTALRPRPSTAIALTARTGVYLRPRDVARIARTATENVDGVTSATANATRRTVTVSVRAIAPGQIAADVQQAVAHALDALAAAPRIRVRVTPERGPR
ncbi:DUF6286 domain-containing protein [Pengzhenrongella frigida]|uniref:DUF6286 domain-containing protein n=1 Tax=Pengzhenrongella frigida TaxID=1259133 RepID=A0A4Q5N0T8_9MICO|nr:DUF6286 domain-containing protein [Cellulomonas sp. HLT2-17]RYV50843.1 hypothetical protein EUA98_11260 [Cellulomonas sp. HLT2-17]